MLRCRSWSRVVYGVGCKVHFSGLQRSLQIQKEEQSQPYTRLSFYISCMESRRPIKSHTTNKSRVQHHQIPLPFILHFHLIIVSQATNCYLDQPNEYLELRAMISVHHGPNSSNSYNSYNSYLALPSPLELDDACSMPLRDACDR